MKHERIYFDNAATTWPKPETVYKAVDHTMRDIGAAAGRGAYRESLIAGAIISQAREKVGKLVGATDSNRILFTCNGTDSTNQAIFGVYRHGSHVITSDAEHNSVLRPLRYLESIGQITLSHARCDRFGRVDPAEIISLWRPKTGLVAITHASNVTGAIQDVAAIGAIVRERDAILLLDAAQTLGCHPIHLEEQPIDLLASSGHKSLFGPLGTGVLYVGPRVSDFRPSRFGGTGDVSDSDAPLVRFPASFEVGNQNVPAIAGLSAGVAWITERGIDSIADHLSSLARDFVGRMSEIRGVTLVGRDESDADLRDDRSSTGVVSFQVEAWDPHDFAVALDSTFGVQLRSGLHCAARIHTSIGSHPGGTIRASFSALNSPEQIERAARSMAELLR